MDGAGVEDELEWRLGLVIVEEAVPAVTRLTSTMDEYFSGQMFS